MFRSAYLILGVSVIIGGSLEKVIPYTPAFPIVLLVASAVCLAAAVRAGRYSLLLPDPAQYIGGLLYTVFVGSGVNLLFSGLSTIKGALHVSGGVASGGSLNVLLALSWPAVVISALAIALAIRVARRTRGRDERKLPAHAR